MDKAADAASGAAHAVGHTAHKAKDAIVGKGRLQVEVAATRHILSGACSACVMARQESRYARSA